MTLLFLPDTDSLPFLVVPALCTICTLRRPARLRLRSGEQAHDQVELLGHAAGRRELHDLLWEYAAFNVSSKANSVV